MYMGTAGEDEGWLPTFWASRARRRWLRPGAQASKVGVAAGARELSSAVIRASIGAASARTRVDLNHNLLPQAGAAVAAAGSRTRWRRSGRSRARSAAFSTRGA
jgi:hypothetical protein